MEAVLFQHTLYITHRHKIYALIIQREATSVYSCELAANPVPERIRLSALEIEMLVIRIASHSDVTESHIHSHLQNTGCSNHS